MKYLDLKSNGERMIINLRALKFVNVVVLGHYSYKEAKKKLDMHQHDEMIEICFLESGSQYYKVGSENYFLKGGDILITHPNVIHGTSSYPEEKGSLFWLIIKAPKIPFKLLNLSTKESKLLIDRILNVERIHFKGSVEMKKLLTDIFYWFNKKSDPLSKVEITNHLLRFLLQVIQCSENIDKNYISNDIEYCKKYIEENVFQKIYISDLAARINLSESRFKHKFKEELGTPPNEYVLKVKIEKAKNLLSSKEVSISDIAYDLGFSSSSYFSTVFKKFQGISPTEFKLIKN